MTRLCSLMILVVMCLSCFICFSIADKIRKPIYESGATIRGEVIDLSPEQKPIEGVTVKIVDSAFGQEYILTTNEDGAYEKTGLQAGRYTMSYSKKGYGDRIGNSRVVAFGGEIFDRIKMRKNDTIFTYFQRKPLNGLLFIGITVGIVATFVILFIDLRKSRVWRK